MGCACFPSRIIVNTTIKDIPIIMEKNNPIILEKENIPIINASSFSDNISRKDEATLNKTAFFGL